MTIYKYIEPKISAVKQGIALAEKFEKILECDSEETIHKFLFENTVFFNCLCDNDSLVFSKFKLADNYIPDFVLLGEERRTNSLGAYTSLIEIERSDKPLFTKAGDPSAVLTHAIRQTQNWKSWITENRPFLRNKFKDIIIQNPPKRNEFSSNYERNIEHFGLDYRLVINYYCIVGRRKYLTIKNNILLSQMNDDLIGINIITYDVLLENFVKSLMRIK